MHTLHRDIVALRRAEPDLADFWLDDMGVEFDEHQRWIVLKRGTLTIACNLGEASVAVHVMGELVRGWDKPAVGATSTTLEGQSFAVART